MKGCKAEFDVCRKMLINMSRVIYSPFHVTDIMLPVSEKARRLHPASLLYF